jgi:hypothetical protein
MHFRIFEYGIEMTHLVVLRLNAVMTEVNENEDHK